MVVRGGEPAPQPQNEGRSAIEASGFVDRVVRVLRGLTVAGAIAFFWSAALVLAWFVVPYVSLRYRDRLARRRRLQEMIAASWRWFLGVCEWLTIYRARYQGELPTEGPCVMIANHPSLLDVTAIIGRMPHACCVVKNSLMESPLIGRLLRELGHIAAGDGSLMAGLQILDTVRERLQEGFPVLIFPEGTRSPRGGMHRFRRGAFVIAQRAGAPVLPVFLRCDPPALGKGSPLFRHPRACPTLTVQFDPAVRVQTESPVTVCKNVEREFRVRLGLPVATDGSAGE